MALFNELLSEPNSGDANISGVAIGVVKENWDDKHPGMVKVEISLGTSGKSLTDWTPVAVPYAGKQYGTYFLPEVGTQVLVAFHMGDINCPIVIGCMWNQKDINPPAAANEKNTIKTIRTKGGNQIVISEESGKETITIETTGKQKLFLDDENKKISLQDEKGDNAIILDSKEGKLEFICKKKAAFKINGKELLTLDGNGQSITLKTGKIQIEADQSVKLKGQKLSAEGGATEIKGQSVKMESQTTLNIKGTASLKVESSGITEVKGSMVKVN
ncbi:MAG: hypothetical protein J1E64_08980 [Acetatifactor sp.]|nr:hypothetical protein [Acetatifactor sp.]